ncbi:MAG TPA: hypothetical protein VGS27_08400 [Candidatus Sulfotelmatobacter sp.]|nr:hypothetical protein [Candidatus Sulfotelmatobacter sp.]
MIIPDPPYIQSLRMPLLYGTFIALLLLPTLPSQDAFLAAQNSNGKPYAVIVGTVWGPHDQPVYGVTVKIRKATDKPKKVRWEVYSDHHGEFEQRLPAGEAEYIVWADLKRFKSPDGQPVHLVKEVTVHIYNDERQDIGLHLEH